MLIAAVLCAAVAPARGDLVYNYQQNWMFDPASGLYWQVLPIPLSTFVPSAGTVATYQQLVDLGNDAGIPGGLINLGQGQPAAYSLPLASLLSFFQAGTPAQPSESQPNLFVSNYYYAAEPPPDSFEYTSLTYSPTDATRATWLYVGQHTIGTYGPTHPGPVEPAFVVSTVQPTPVPSAVWLMVSGLAILACICGRRTPGRPTSSCSKRCSGL
jgi:hypothetical protein